MLPPQTPYTAPPNEVRPEMQPPIAEQPLSPEYNEQFIETLARRLMPRLMPEIMYNLRSVEPARSHHRPVGLSFALAVVSMAFMIALLGIAMQAFTTFTGVELVPMLFGVGIVALLIVAFNVMYNYFLFNPKNTSQ